MEAHLTKRNAVIILTPGFPESERDTTCLPQIQQFCRLAKEEFPDTELLVVTMQYPFNRSVYQWHGLTVYAAGGKNRGSVQRLLTWVRAWRHLASAAKEFHVRGVLSLWLTETALVGKWFARSGNIPHYTWLQGQDAKKRNRYVRMAGLSGRELIAISEFNKAELEKNHGIVASLIAHNGIDQRVFPALNNGEREIDILGAGSLIPLKRYDLFVRTVFRLKKQFPSIRAVLVGAGPEERSLQELAFSLGLEHTLKFVGQVPHSEVLRLMSRSKVLLHPSTYEGLSTVTLEALYSGCDVVASIPAGNKSSDHIRLCSDEDCMIAAAASFLEKDLPRERVMMYDMRDTVNRIIGLFVNRQKAS